MPRTCLTVSRGARTSQAVPQGLTSLCGKCWATATAQLPAPLPQSRIRRGDLTGGNIKRSSKTNEKMLCISSSLDISHYSTRSV